MVRGDGGNGVGSGNGSWHYFILLRLLHVRWLIWGGICATSILKCVQCNQVQIVMDKSWLRVGE